MKESTFIYRGRFILLIGLLGICFAMVFVRLYFLHVVNRESSIEEVDSVRSRFSVLSARRGNITDSHGKLLAATRPVIELGVDPVDFGVNRDLEIERATKRNEKETFSERFCELARILNVSEGELRKVCVEEVREVEDDKGIKRQRNVRWRKISCEIDDLVYERIKELKIKGIYGNRKYVRVYPSEFLASHVLGFVNKEFNPEMGVEKQFDFYLRGQDGWLQSEQDKNRREMPQFRAREIMPVEGANVELSIDVVMQEAACSELNNIVEKYSPLGATIIISEPATGFILAMASYPTFNPNSFNKYPTDSLRNRAICDVMEPGSTFKIVPIAGALNEKIVTQDDVFDCSDGVIEYKGRRLKLPKDSHPEGRLSVREITAKSSNRGAAHLGVLLGENRLYNYAKAFGFGERTNLGLIGERMGTLHSPRSSGWDGLTITRLPMGHAVSATPLQIHSAMCAIANQGILMQPQLVKRVYDNEDKDIVTFSPKAVRRVVSSKTASLMCDILSDVVGSKGTASKASIGGYRVAGKTGTTKKIVDGQYSSTKHIASFTGFFPSQRPRIAVTIIVDEPKTKGVGYGGSVAAPSFSHIAKRAANYYGIQTDEEFEKMVAWKERN